MAGLPESRRGARRRDRLLREREHDPYRPRRKLAEPTACTQCSAVYRNGRWQWLTVPFEAARALCPACQRMRDGYPAGELRLAGPFLADHVEEILGLARNVAQRQSAQHPLQRLMKLEERDDTWLVQTTDMHLARTIGEAIHSAYEGDLSYEYPRGASLLRVYWSR